MTDLSQHFPKAFLTQLMQGGAGKAAVGAALPYLAGPASFISGGAP
jgi:hypothetical protein